MNKELQLPLWIVCGYVFIIVGILADDWILRLTWLGLGMASLLANVLLTKRKKNDPDSQSPVARRRE